VTEMRPRVSCDDYGERRIRRGKPEVGPCSLRGRCRSATAGGCQWLGRPTGQRTSRLCATPSGAVDASDVFKAGLRDAGEALETVRIDHGSRCDVLDKERNYRGGLEVRNHFHPDSTGSLPTLFDRDQGKSGAAVLELSAPSETGLFPANPRVINLHLTVQRLPKPGVGTWRTDGVAGLPIRRLARGRIEDR